jgi:hypothetical protein
MPIVERSSPVILRYFVAFLFAAQACELLAARALGSHVGYQYAELLGS